MTIAQTHERSPRKPIRLWPGVAAAVLLLVFRFGVKAVIPGFQGFAWGMQGALVCTGAVIVWWAFLSRARWTERLGAIVLMVVAVGVAWLLRHESMGPLWLVAYAIPFSCLAFVVWAVASARLADGPRRATMVATIILACGVWTLVRMEGITGDHVARFAWRWTESAEERLLARVDDKPVDPSTSSGSSRAQSRDDSARAEPTTPAPAQATTKTDAERPVTSERSFTRAEWPGFRGQGRNGIIRGIQIETDWSRTPPVELWRRSIGPGWSSFAVAGDRLYTQEQRGDEEVVSSYKVTTGDLLWTHSDAARFFESNAGTGPRGTPTLANGRIYTFGATGILNSLEADDGAVVWSRNVAADTGTTAPYWGFSSSPLVVDDLVVVAAAGQLVAYDLTTGKPRWSGPKGGDGYSSPHLMTLDGVAQILFLSEAGTISVAPGDGKVLWEHAWKGLPIVQPAVTTDGDVLIVATTGGGTRRLAIAQAAGTWTVKERWTSLGLKPYFNDFVVHEGHAFGFDGRILACIELENGERKWKGGRYGNGQLVLLPEQDLLLVLSEEGELALVNATPEQYTEVARFKAIEGKTWNHPVLVRNILLVRNGEEMAAFRLSLAARSTSSPD